MHNDPTIPFTRSAYDGMRQEVNRLQRELEEVKVRLQTAREMGDLSENGAYHAAKFEFGSITRELRRLRGLLRQGYVNNSTQTGSVGFGSTVTLHHNGTQVEYFMVSMHESDLEKHKLSLESPLGKALVGKKVGEIVRVQTPSGETEYAIKSIL